MISGKGFETTGSAVKSGRTGTKGIVGLMNSTNLRPSDHASGPSPDGSGAIRDLAIDRLRGALVILMVTGDYLAGIGIVPSFLKHAPDIGFTVADTVAPAFVFVIGLNFGESLSRRLREGRAAAYRYFLMRYLALTGIGAIIAAGATATGQPTDWGVLQAIGVAGLIGLIFIRFPVWVRFAVGALMLCGYQYLLDTVMLDTVLRAVHGGLFGAVSWGALLVLSTAVADVWRKGRMPYAACLVALVVAAAVSAIIVPVSKNRVSLSFILIALALSAVVFLVVQSATRAAGGRAGFLCWWGENALALYLIHLLVLSVFVAPQIAWWYVEAPAWLAAMQLAVILGLMSVVAWRVTVFRAKRNSAA
jgi:predicted acyltransferase